MRRRIYINPEGPLEDDTTKVYLFEPESDDDGTNDWCRRRALYDDKLWEAYEVALREASRLRGLVLDALVSEPYDEIELALKAESDKLDAFEEFDLDAEDRIARLALMNAMDARPKDKP